MLLRDAGGSLPEVKPINEVFQASFASVTEMPVENGVAKLLGMAAGEVSPPSEDKKADLEERLERTEELLEKHDVVYTHLKGPDEPAHDGDFEKKVQAIDEIDKYFVKVLLDHYDLNELAVLVTADHATPPDLKVHSDDPIPFMIAYEKLEPDNIKEFSERECMKGSLGVIEHGWELLPMIMKMIRQ
jgi:2,3-bisphosphoglycerate-independent phosphoglycerate mutase